MLDFGENFGTEFSEWILDLKGLFDPDSISRKISDYLEENPVPEEFHKVNLFFYYDFNIKDSIFMINELVPLKDVDASYIDKLRENKNFTFFDFKNILNLNMSDNPENFEKEFHEWNKGLEDSFNPAKVSGKIYDYLEKYPVPENYNLDGMSFIYDLNIRKGILAFSELTPRRDMRAKSAGKLQKGITLPDFKKSLYFLMDEYDLTATMIVADDLDTLESLYVRSVKGEYSFSDSYSSSDLGKVLDRNSSYFDKNYTGFRLYDSGKNDIFVVFRKLESEAVLVNTSLRKSQLSAKKILSYF